MTKSHCSDYYIVVLDVVEHRHLFCQHKNYETFSLPLIMGKNELLITSNTSISIPFFFFSTDFRT